MAADRLAATLALDEPASRVKAVSPARASALAGLGLRTVRDLVNHFPRRYIDLSHVATVAVAQIGAACTIAGTIHEVKLKRPKPRLSLVEITIVDGTGTLIVTAFRQPWLAKSLEQGMRVAVAGKVEFDYGFKRMVNPFIEELSASQGAGGMVVPVHPACDKVSAAWMRRIIRNALDTVRGAYDPLPVSLRAKYRLMSRGRALEAIHFPESLAEADQARRRLVYEELLLTQLMLMEGSRRRFAGKQPHRHVIDGPRLRALAAAVPFALTEDQARARQDILGNMAAAHCMNHLLLGDVGTGKTIVAAYAIAAASDTGTQALLMAPTEVLAQQHAASLGPLFDSAGITWEMLTASTPASQRSLILERAAAGVVDVLIGTHALLEDDVRCRACSLVIIDEQQRFGVDQRAALMAKGEAPDALYLTATPIPRTLALALFGDLTLSYLTQRPAAAARRTTRALPKAHRGVAYDAARAAVSRGEQVYVVCPLIGLDSDARDEKAQAAPQRDVAQEAYEYAAISIETEDDFEAENVAAAVQEARTLQSSVFADSTVELLHGMLPASEKREVMQRFRDNETQVLVATTVIEVGVDVPNATVMIVEDADRFGLSQLHQLRGRVGRGQKPGEVFLVSASKSDAAMERLSAMERTEDGFEVAAYDLSLRREGDILGNRQHGASALKLVNIVRDGAVIEAAHADAAEILRIDPDLSLPEHRALAREVRLQRRGDAVVQGG